MSHAIFPAVTVLVSLCIAICLAAPEVETSCGRIEGVEKDGAYSFRGIPYARPPIEELRWQPPVPLRHQEGTCWKGTLQATEFGTSCYQPSISKYVPETFGSEDCLFLNVWTPTTKADHTKRPVMVYIHGGSLQMGNGSMPTYSPTEKLARDTDIVYVSMNYRLHAFGFLALEILAEASSTKSSGNYGLMDVLLALRWVQDNIAQFGGDPNQVTVFGQSSGGTIIYALLTSSFSQGLFHKAWMSSASPKLSITAEQAFVDNEGFLTSSGCHDITCLYAMTTEEVFSSIPWFQYPAWAMSNQMDLPKKGVVYGGMVIIDGYVLSEEPFEAMKNGHMMDVPLMIGTTANEIDVSPVASDVTVWNWVNYQQYVTDKIGTFGEEILIGALKLYPTGHETPEYQLTAMASDIRVNCGNGYLAYRAATSFTSPVYQYVVTADPSEPVHALGLPFPARYAFHMWDIFAFFGVIENYIKSPTQEDMAYQTNLQKEILNFVRHGTPKTSAWTQAPGSTAMLEDGTRVEGAHRPLHCAFWFMNDFFDYSFVN